jgi:disulfide bond formation protein DsbB
MPAVALTQRTTASVIVASSALALAAAFTAQYIFGLEPCALCIYQRWPYGAAIALGLAALAARGRPGALVVGLAAVAFAVDAGIAAYHVGVEEGVFEGLAACGGAAGDTPDTVEQLKAQLLAGPPPDCADVPWSLFGVSMAGYNALYAAALAIFSFTAAGRLARRAP